MNKDNFNKAVEAFLKVLVVIGIIYRVLVSVFFLVFTILFVKNFGESKNTTDEELSIKREEEVQILKNYLEDKYGERFIVNPNGQRDTGSFIPGAVNTSPDYYEAYSEEDSEFIFRVYKYSESSDIKSKEKIRDSYCWKFLKEELRNTIESTLTDELPAEYKIFIDTYSDITFDNSIRQDSSLEQYFSSNNDSPIIFINIYALDSQENVEKKIEQRVSLLFDEFKNKYNSLNISFRYYSVENEKDFSLINTKELEKKSLFIYGDNYPEIFSKIKVERKFVVKIDTID